MLPDRRLFIAGLGAAAAGPVLGTTIRPLTEAEAAAVRAVVQGQLDALARDDADKAFSYAAPNVRNRLGSAERFLAMVRASYPVVYRPASVDFLVAQRVTGGTVVQRVRMADARNQSWMAIYTLQQQKNRDWRISGCEVQPATGRAA